jgi:serine protease
VFWALGCAGLLVAAGAPAIASATDAPSTGGPSEQSPIASSTAANRAGDVYEDTAKAAGAPVPIVTVETTPSGPRITSHSVTSESQARSVGSAAAVGNDLVIVKPDSIVRPMGAPTNDQFAANQWGLDRAKTTFADAWNTTRGRGITVAVIDTGVDAAHPDLAGQVINGKAFLSFTRDTRALNPKIDSCGHGTHVAGTIAALRGNGIGVTGAAPEVKIMPIKVLDQLKGCGGYSSDVANGITWAANNGARVINLSLGGTMRDSAQEAAIAYARSKGVVVVAAAGNNQYSKTCNPGGTNATSYPGASPGVIAVAAMDPSFGRACFSNIASYVDITGPGTNILSTYPPAIVPKAPAGQAPYPPYMFMSGTSMATPHVAAAAALVLAKWPTCTPDRVENRLESYAKRIGSTGRNNSFGFGLVDPARAIAGTARTC